MKFKTKLQNSIRHEGMGLKTCWSFSSYLYTIGEDNKVLCLDYKTNQYSKVIEFGNEKIISSFDVFGESREKGDLFCIGFSDGSMKICNKFGQIQKSEDKAHQGSVIYVKWSNDGLTIATCGEDNIIKTWAKNGIFRFELLKIEWPAYCLSWSPENDFLAISTFKMVYIKPLKPGKKHTFFKAHDGVVLSIDWNYSNNLILTCGEDYKYKIWDSHGRLIFSSFRQESIPTSIAWCPNGEYFGVGFQNIIKLCLKNGITQEDTHVDGGSILGLSWSGDSSVISFTNIEGRVYTAYVIEKSIEWENWNVILKDEDKLFIFDLINDKFDDLSFKDSRIININFQYNYLIVLCIDKCYIYNINNLVTPSIINIKNSVNLILQSKKNFCLIDVVNGPVIYSYEGKKISNPKLPALKYTTIQKKKISFSNDIISIIEVNNPCMIKNFDSNNGKLLSTIEHNNEIIEFSLNNILSVSDKKFAFLDNNKDLFLCPILKKDIKKISTMCDSFKWHDNYDVLAAICDLRALVWFYPNAAYIDKELLKSTLEIHENINVGRECTITQINNSYITISKYHGGNINIGLSQYPFILFDYFEKSNTQKALHLCRFLKDKLLWACLAGKSLNSKDIALAENPLANIESIDKIQYINKIFSLPQSLEELKQARILLLFKKFDEAEKILIQGKLYYRVIKLNINNFKWKRALELANKFNCHVDTVLAYRNRYLEEIEKEETITEFKKLKSSYNINWESIKNKIKEEKENEVN